MSKVEIQTVQLRTLMRSQILSFCSLAEKIRLACLKS